MRHFRMTALTAALACGLALGACGADSAPTTAIPLTAEGTVDQGPFLELLAHAEETITSKIRTSRMVDPVTRDPLDEDSETSYIDHEAEYLLRIEIIDGTTYETFQTAESTWTRINGGQWESTSAEFTPEEPHSYWENPRTTSIEIIDLDARIFRIHQEYRNDGATYTPEVTLDGQMRVIESFTDYGNGTAILQQITSINEPVEFPTDLPI